MTDGTPDWYVADSGASTHMKASPNNLSNASPYKGNANVMFGNGHTLNVSHTGHTQLSKDIKLQDVLVVPHLTKNLLSISKLTTDNSVDVLFSQPYFTIQDRKTGQALARGKCENGLYVISADHHQAFVAAATMKVHMRLGINV